MITGPGTSGQGVTVGKAGAKAHIDLYLDFRCPHCAEFEESTGATIDKLVEDGTATLTYWPLAFVNPDASPRLANAFAAAAANGKALSYADEMYADFSKSWTTDQLIELGKQLGIGDAKFQQALKDNTYSGWLDTRLEGRGRPRCDRDADRLRQRQAAGHRPTDRRRSAEGRRCDRELTHRVPIVTMSFWPCWDGSSSVPGCHV